jgi:hypothetical protein
VQLTQLKNWQLNLKRLQLLKTKLNNETTRGIFTRRI